MSCNASLLHPVAYRKSSSGDCSTRAATRAAKHARWVNLTHSGQRCIQPWKAGANFLRTASTAAEVPAMTAASRADFATMPIADKSQDSALHAVVRAVPKLNRNAPENTTSAMRRIFTKSSPFNFPLTESEAGRAPKREPRFIQELGKDYEILRCNRSFFACRDLRVPGSSVLLINRSIRRISAFGSIIGSGFTTLSNSK